MFGETESEPLTAWTSSTESPGESALPALPAQTQSAPMQSQPTAPASPAPAAPVYNDASARRGAGTAILLAGTGLAIGWLVGGGWGAGAGFVLVGAARNGWRAKSLWSSQQPGDREEAAKSATMAAIGAAVGGYLTYRAARSRKE